jgi:DDE superfamily endonuclease
VVCPVDDTTPQHKGKNVYGKGRHRDNCRSTRSHTVWVFGHKWVTLAVNVKFPFASRPWALPVLCALYRPKDLDEGEGRRHKTPCDLARQLVAVMVHWFPRRRFILLGDGGYASHELARFCRRHRRHLTLVALFHPRANLYAPPPPRRKGRPGRPRVKGEKLAAPEDVVAGARRKRSTVGWYGGKKRRVEFVSGTGHGYKGGGGLVPVRWVFVHDLDGTHEDRYFYCTDPSLSPSRIVTLYTGRWSIEVTYQEARCHLGFHTPRSWKEKSVLRTAPCLLGLFSVVCLIHQRHTRGRGARPAAAAWHHKAEPTFADAVADVRRLLWSETILKEGDPHEAFQKLPPDLRHMLLEQLSNAA